MRPLYNVLVLSCTDTHGMIYGTQQYRLGWWFDISHRRIYMIFSQCPISCAFKIFQVFFPVLFEQSLHFPFQFIELSFTCRCFFTCFAVAILRDDCLLYKKYFCTITWGINAHACAIIEACTHKVTCVYTCSRNWYHPFRLCVYYVQLHIARW